MNNNRIMILVAILATFCGTVAMSAHEALAQFGPSNQVQVVNQPTVTVGNLPSTQNVSFNSVAQPVTIGAPVTIDSSTPVNVAMTSGTNRYFEFIGATEVDGVSKTVNLAHAPKSASLVNLSSLHPIWFRKGGAPATTADLQLGPGQSVTLEDQEVSFSVYGNDETVAPSFQIASVYEVAI